MLYPANFWPHKNHLGLFEGLRIYRQQHPDSQLKLVCTGAPNALMHTLELAAESQFPAGTVVFAGYLPEAALASLFDACTAVIYPSLYEGFGMLILEAMAHYKPCCAAMSPACPKWPAMPRSTLIRPIHIRWPPPSRPLATRPDLPNWSSAGSSDAAAIGTGRDMAVRYLALVRQVLAARTA